MNRFFIPFLLFVSSFYNIAGAQTKFSPLDKSPMDMSYCPSGYPLLKIQDKTTGPLIARAVYSRPQKNGRVIFGELVEYGQVWRLGANEASEIEFFKPVKINGTKVKKGRYTMYCIPYTDKWTIIINKETDIWGAFKYDEKKDLLRVTLPVEKLVEPAEDFTILFERTLTGANLIVAWDDARISLPLSF